MSHEQILILKDGLRVMQDQLGVMNESVDNMRGSSRTRSRRVEYISIVNNILPVTNFNEDLLAKIS